LRAHQSDVDRKDVPCRDPHKSVHNARSASFYRVDEQRLSRGADAIGKNIDRAAARASKLKIERGRLVDDHKNFRAHSIERWSPLNV
jgi:hypothetical protein